MAPFPSMLALISFHLQLLIPQVVASGNNAHRQRRRLAPNESIHRYLREENEAGNLRPKFTLVSEMKLDDDEDSPTEDEKYFDIDVVQAASAVTASTTYSMYGGPHYPIGDLGVKFLFQDRSAVENNDAGIAHTMIDAKPTTFAIIAVDESTETVQGIAKKQGENAMNVHQMNGLNSNNVIATPVTDFVPPEDFSCQTSHEHHHSDSGERARGRRILVEDEVLPVDKHQIDDHHHHHDDDHNHDHNHEHIFSGDGDEIIDNLINEISHHKKQHGDPIPQYNRRTGFGDSPSNQVDLYIEIDRRLIAKNGNNRTKAFQYINAIVSAASAIYEAEVDTRLTVAHIEVTQHYESFKNSRLALEEMTKIYGNAGGRWHYEEGNGVDLHHAILGQQMNGGIAYIDSLCSPTLGFGLSPTMRGSFLSLDYATVWDTAVVAHEIGHNFGVFHTYDRRGFKPPVDRCYIRSNDDSNCPSDTSLRGAATLMSYCDTCPGADVRSLAYTFGGHFVGDDPSDIDGWRNDPTLFGSFNNEPKRVPKAMYDNVSELQCTLPTFSCVEDSDCYDSRLCTIDTCNRVSGQCEQELKVDCCGNGICEWGEVPCSNNGFCPPQNQRTCLNDCGPFDLETKSCYKCNAKRGRGNGIMFDIHSMKSETVLINSMDFRHTETQLSTVSIYTADGNYVDRATSSEEWTFVQTVDIEIGGRKGGYASVEFEVPIAIGAASTRAFYIASTGKLISGHSQEEAEHLAIDDTLSIKNPARIVGSTTFGGGMEGSWDGKLRYSIYTLPPQTIFKN